MLDLPWRERLDSAKTVLIAGAGGGFDLFSGLPLYFALRAAGKQVHLASFSFTYLGGTDADDFGLGVRRVTGETGGEEKYFPEKHLAAWLAMDGDDKPIWTIERLGLEQLTDAYAMLTRRLEPDAVVVVDGGTDSLMRGDEAGLGTPAEDIASILAAAALDVPSKMLVCLGFGVDRFHGVCHAQFLEGVAELARTRAYLGALSLTRDMPEVRKFEGVTEYVQARTPGRESVVCASILSALEGRYGNYHRLERTEKTGSTLWINPLMSLYWFFDLDAVAKRVLYKDLLQGTESLAEINVRIEAFRKSVHIRPREDIPA
jgi:hypothetical protein